MSTQPIETHTEQATDPQVRDRLMQAIEDVDREMLRGRVTRAARSAYATRYGL